MTKLTFGPIVYHWSAEARRGFYACIVDEAPCGEVYLGEVICSKRAPFHEPNLPETIARLERAGKRVNRMEVSHLHWGAARLLLSSPMI